MESYRIFFRRSAVKELENIPPAHLKRIISRIESLTKEPRPSRSQKLSSEERYRLRQGPYRIIYSVSDEERTVIITKIGHRREVYRK